MTPKIGKQIAAEAEGWLGTPFVWQASVKGAGADCKGLIAGVARGCGRTEGSSVEALAGDYARVVPLAALRAGLARLFDCVTERQAGDVLLVRTGGAAQHLAFAAPTEKHPLRTIEALHMGPRRVVEFRRGADEVDSIWRWRDRCR